MKKRLPEFAEALLDVYSDFSEGDMTLEEFKESLFMKSAGLNFKRNPIDLFHVGRW